MLLKPNSDILLSSGCVCKPVHIVKTEGRSYKCMCLVQQPKGMDLYDLKLYILFLQWLFGGFVQNFTTVLATLCPFGFLTVVNKSSDEVKLPGTQWHCLVSPCMINASCHSQTMEQIVNLNNFKLGLRGQIKICEKKMKTFIVSVVYDWPQNQSFSPLM